MRTYRAPLTRSWRIGMAVWLAACVVFGLAGYEVGLPTMVVWHAALVLVGACLGLSVLLNAVINFSGRRFGIAVAIAVVAFVWTGPSPLALDLARRVKLYRLEASYLDRIDQALAGDAAGCACLIDAGPPVRVAFSWYDAGPQGHGIAHDPDQLLDRLTPADGVDTLFDGRLSSARHLWGPWYFVGLRRLSPPGD